MKTKRVSRIESCRPRVADPSCGARLSPAFTLIELMIVVSIMALVLAMGIPTMFRMAEKDSLRQVVAGIVEACHSARAQAILSGQTQTMTIHPRDHTLEAPGKSEPFVIPERFQIAAVAVNFVEVDEYPSAPVRFYPNGTCDEFTIVIVSDRNEKRIISLDIVTSLADVDTDESKFRRQW